MALGNLSDKRKSVWTGGSYVVEWFQAGDGNLKAGIIAEDDDADEIKICATDGVPYCVVGDLPTLDLDTAQTAGLGVYGFLLGSGAKVMTGHDTTVEASAKGQICHRSDGVAGTTESAPADAAYTNVVGRWLETLAAAADKWIETLI